LPGSGGFATVATITAGSAAGSQIFWGNLRLELATGVNANSVGHGLNSAESPARAAGALVSDLGDGLAFWPLLAGIEVSGQSIDEFMNLDGEAETTFLDAHKSADSVLRCVGIEVAAGLKNIEKILKFKQSITNYCIHG